jgi:hypothetical protein
MPNIESHGCSHVVRIGLPTAGGPPPGGDWTVKRYSSRSYERAKSLQIRPRVPRNWSRVSRSRASRQPSAAPRRAPRRSSIIRQASACLSSARLRNSTGRLGSLPSHQFNPGVEGLPRIPHAERPHITPSELCPSLALPPGIVLRAKRNHRLVVFDPHAREVHRFPHIALRGGAIAEQADRDPGLLSQLKGISDTGRMRRV